MMCETKTQYPEQEPDYKYLAELVFKSQKYPEHLLITRGELDVKTGHYASVINREGTICAIEAAMRYGVEQGLKPLGALYTSQDVGHVLKPDEYLSEEQKNQILPILHELDTESVDKFWEYMGVKSVSQIKAKDYKKASSVLDGKSKDKK